MIFLIDGASSTSLSSMSSNGDFEMDSISARFKIWPKNRNKIDKK